MRAFLRLLWTALVLVTVALVSALVTMRLAIHGRQVEVPDLTGKTPSEARRVAEVLGLAAQVERQYYSSTVPEGRVLSQNPMPGTVVRRGWQLRLAVSLGPQRVAIPQVVGESQRAATIILQQRGLDESVAQINLPGARAGEVLAQDPAANSADVAAPKVSVLVAADTTPQPYVMASFVGRPLGSVTLAIKDAGFILGTVTVAPAPAGANSAASGGNPGESTANAAAATASQSTLPQNIPINAPSPASIVVSQQPAAGQKIVTGAEIRLVVR